MPTKKRAIAEAAVDTSAMGLIAFGVFLAKEGSESGQTELIILGAVFVLAGLGLLALEKIKM